MKPRNKELSGRHGSKHKGNKPKKNIPTATSRDAQPSKEPAKPKPEEALTYSVKQGDNAPVKLQWKAKPDPHDIALWGLIVAFLVLTVYGLQLKAMLDSNQINRDSLQTVQRAFVTFSPNAEIATRIENGKVVSWSPEIPITNSGATPTKDLIERGNIYTSDKEIPEDFAFHDTGPPQRGVLGPKDTVSYETQPIPIQAIRAIREQGAHVYIYGWATYRDLFPGTPHHITEFCYELRLNSGTGDLTSPEYRLPGRFMTCRRHNCADDGCRNEKTPTTLQ